ncbi:MAG TPA: cupin domain-containing protein [Solirubrobacteraceae bacterium]|nr:cupin domain-containing protein [Solirubrobacteraceae bacterium]
MHVRRVVTGHDDAGRSVFASDEQVAPLRLGLFPGWEFHALWGGDEPPAYPGRGTRPPACGYFPALNGFRFSFSTIPPHGTAGYAGEDPGRDAAAVEEAMAGLLGHMEPDEPGMHTTDTIDLEVILSGEAILELDDGAERRLRTGDTVVQNGTRHRWRNPGSEPCVMAIFMLGARRYGSPACGTSTRTV